MVVMVAVVVAAPAEVLGAAGLVCDIAIAKLRSN